MACEDSFWYFLTNYCFTLDPKNPDRDKRVRKVEPFPFVTELAEALPNGRPTHIVKSRQMVVTTVICAFFLWRLMFSSGWSGLMMSRKDTLVDDGGSQASWNSLFGKVLFMWRRLPAHLKHSLEIKANRILCPARESYIIGESGNVPDAGRGGVFSTALLDEAAKIPRSESVWSSLQDAASQVIMNSTPYGKGNLFFRIHKNPDSKFQKLRFHWSRHPERDQAWYADQCVDRTPEQIAEELDMSFERSVVGRCIPEFNYDKHVRVGLRYDPDLRLSGGWDFGIGDPTALVLRQQVGDYHLHPLAIQRPDLRVDQFSEMAIGAVRAMGYQGSIGAIGCMGDPSGAARNPVTGRSIFHEYHKEGGWNILPARKMKDPVQWIAALRKVIGKDRWFCSETCVDLIDSLEAMHYPLDSEGKQLPSENPDPKAHEYTHSPAANGYDLGSHVHVHANARTESLAGV